MYGARDYGQWGGPRDVIDVYAKLREDPGFLALARKVNPHVAHLNGGPLAEASGTGAPEGRADFPIFLQTIIRTRVRERFQNVAAKWERYMGVESAQDLRQHTVHELGAIRGIRPVREEGEYGRMRSKEAPGPPYSVGKHGGIYSVTMELIINDDANTILNRIPREIGRASAEYVSQAAVAFIESNPTYIDGQPFFGAAHGNEVTGVGAEPSEDSLVTAADTIKLRRDEDNIPVGFELNGIIVRTERHRLTFQRIIRSAETGTTINFTGGAGAGTAVFDKGTDNPLFGILPPDAVVDEPWLNDANDWYALSNADGRAAFIMAFLRGQRNPFIGLMNPQVRGQGAGDDPYTMEHDDYPYKHRHFFGVAQGDPNAAMRMRP